MKKKLNYVVLIMSIFMINSSVSAANIFGDSSKKDVCGLSLPSNVPAFTSGLFNLVKILVPIILIVMGMVDFAKAVMANDEKKMKDSRDKFVRRLIAAVFIFFIVAIVQFVFKQVSNENGFTSCMNCVLSDECKDATDGYTITITDNNSTNSTNSSSSTNENNTISNSASTSGAGSLVQITDLMSSPVQNTIESAVSTVKASIPSAVQTSDICSTCQNISDSVTRNACLKGCSNK